MLLQTYVRKKEQNPLFRSTDASMWKHGGRSERIWEANPRGCKEISAWEICNKEKPQNMCITRRHEQKSLLKTKTIKKHYHGCRLCYSVLRCKRDLSSRYFSSHFHSYACASEICNYVVIVHGNSLCLSLTHIPLWFGEQLSVCNLDIVFNRTWSICRYKFFSIGISYTSTK